MDAGKSLIFGSATEDFFKIFFASLLVFALSFNSNFIASPILLLATIYLLDGGHVYSTLLEVYADPIELRKSYVWSVTIGSFFLNLAVLFFIPEFYFFYIFYFTVFHNMRQGLGITFLYKKGEKEGMAFYKYSYYFLTIIPFILFHFRNREVKDQLSESILKSVNLFEFFQPETINSIYQYGLYFFIIGMVFILSFISYKKNYRGFWSLGFFSFVYIFSFLISRNELQSYILIIFSHAIPYYFLMVKRVEKTHSVSYIKKYASFFLILFFATGALFDFRRPIIIEYFDDVEILISALVVTPLIAHFIFDAIIWKRSNERFKIFLSK
ncbi:MAG: hypothetical protein WC635_04390 [Bacteriovorax sp.]|jgi:hypothetical protein